MSEKTIVGLNNLKRKLDGMADPETVKKGLTKSSLFIEGEAKKNCPVDTGQLKQSITSEVEGFEAAIGSNLEYAPWVELGTGIYATDGHGRQDPWRYQDEKGNWHTTKGQPPNPFLERTLRSNEDTVLTIIKNEIRRAKK